MLRKSAPDIRITAHCSVTIPPQPSGHRRKPDNVGSHRLKSVFSHSRKLEEEFQRDLSRAPKPSVVFFSLIQEHLLRYDMPLPVNGIRARLFLKEHMHLSTLSDICSSKCSANFQSGYVYADLFGGPGHPARMRTSRPFQTCDYIGQLLQCKKTLKSLANKDSWQDSDFRSHSTN